MKVLIVAVCFFVATYGSPVNSGNNLKAEAQKLVDIISTVHDDMVKLLELKKELSGQVFDAGVKIDQVLAENPTVIEAKAKLETVPKCKEVFDRVLFWTARSLKQDYYDSAEFDLRALELNFLIMGGELQQIEEDLIKNVEKLVQQCEKNSSNCRITGIYKTKVNEYVEVIAGVKPILPNIIELSLKRVEEEVLPGEVKVRFEEVKDCFEKA